MIYKNRSPGIASLNPKRFHTRYPRGNNYHEKIMNAWFSKRLNTQWQCPLDIFTDFHYFCWPNVNSIRIHYIMMDTHRKEPVIHTSHIACGWKNYFCEYKEKPILRLAILEWQAFISKNENCYTPIGY